MALHQLTFANIGLTSQWIYTIVLSQNVKIAEPQTNILDWTGSMKPTDCPWSKFNPCSISCHWESLLRGQSLDIEVIGQLLYQKNDRVCVRVVTGQSKVAADRFDGILVAQTSLPGWLVSVSLNSGSYRGSLFSVLKGLKLTSCPVSEASAPPCSSITLP